MEGGLSLSAGPLTDLAGALGVDAAELAAVEGAATLSHTFSITAEAAGAAALGPEAAEAFVAAYGDAASVEIRTGDLVELAIGPTTFSREELVAFARRAASGGPYELAVRIDKDHLARSLVGQPAREVRLFFYAGALSRLLLRGVTRLETELWPHAPAPLVVGILDTDVDLVGPHLAVVGGTALHRMADLAQQPPVDVDFPSLLEARDRHVAWDVRWTDGLTPWHFDLAGSCRDRHLRGLLRAQLVKLAVLFTCERARSLPGTVPPVIRAEYRGREHLAVVPIDERSPLEPPGDEAIASVLGAVDWCYRRRGRSEEPDWVSDRLPFLQTRIAQTLEPLPEPDQRLGALTRAMPYLLEGIEWHWRAFVEGKVGDYLENVEKVENAVADTVTSFADRSAVLVKSLGEAVLAAVAVLVGSFIAAAFRDPFNATLFRFSLRTYAAYVVIFPGVVGLLASSHGIRVTRQTFDARIARFKETLHPDKVDAIAGNRIEHAQTSYYRWLAAVAVIYVLVAIAAWTASTIVPKHIQADPRTPAAITTATPRPRPPKSFGPVFGPNDFSAAAGGAGQAVGRDGQPG